MYQTLRYEKQENIGILTINRPEALNALNSTVIGDLEQAITEVEKDAELGALIITGEGRSFVAGADIGEQLPLDVAGGRKWGQRGSALMRRIEKLEIPTIAAVNGFALGGGCELAMACDIRIATKKSKFGQPEVNLGIIPDGIVGRGPLGLVSKSGTLTYQLMGELSDIGFTACLGAGGDPIVGTTLLEALQAFEADPDTKAVMMIGEIGGFAEQDAAAWAKEHMTKPVVAYIAGFTAPEGKQMGHAGAIVSGGKGTAQDKKNALEAAGIPVGKTPGQAAEIMRDVLAKANID